MSQDAPTSWETNLPEVVAQVRDVFLAYEAALVARELEALADSFVGSDEVVRFGVRDRQQGAAELSAWRAAQPPLPPGRELFDTVITTFGTSVAVVSTCFSYPGRAAVGRQSQTWLRFEERWQIVAAHVSEIPAPQS